MYFAFFATVKGDMTLFASQRDCSFFPVNLLVEQDSFILHNFP